ncbi:MAG TPA: hypothetical protein VGG54_01285 [Trebonia sp.]|jgi:hypothetical protein
MAKNKIEKAQFAYARRWEKYILNDHRELTKGTDDRSRRSKGIDRCTLLAYAFAMSVKGTRGIGCFAGDAMIAKELGLSRDTVTKYRHEAKRLGWFVQAVDDNGKPRSVNRVEVLNISIPVANPGQQPSDTTTGPVAVSGQQQVANPGQHYQGTLLKKSLKVNKDGGCNFPGCTAPIGIWHEHQPDELTALKRSRPDDDDVEPKYRTNPATGKRERIPRSH